MSGANESFAPLSSLGTLIQLQSSEKNKLLYYLGNFGRKSCRLTLCQELGHTRGGDLLKFFPRCFITKKIYKHTHRFILSQDKYVYAWCRKSNFNIGHVLSRADSSEYRGGNWMTASPALLPKNIVSSKTYYFFLPLRCEKTARFSAKFPLTFTQSFSNTLAAHG